jgi:transposase
MKKQTRKHTAEFEAIQGLKGQNGIANDFETHPIMVGKWKNGLIQRKIGQLTTSCVP